MALSASLAEGPGKQRVSRLSVRFCKEHSHKRAGITNRANLSSG
jgi:hypothetical protein